MAKYKGVYIKHGKGRLVGPGGDVYDGQWEFAQPGVVPWQENRAGLLFAFSFVATHWAFGAKCRPALWPFQAVVGWVSSLAPGLASTLCTGMGCGASPTATCMTGRRQPPAFRKIYFL